MHTKKRDECINVLTIIWIKLFMKNPGTNCHINDLWDTSFFFFHEISLYLLFCINKTINKTQTQKELINSIFKSNVFTLLL